MACSFSTYAAARIRGQILDALRAMDLAAPVGKAPGKDHHPGNFATAARSEREPTDEELAAHLDLTLAQVHQAMQDAAFSILSLDTPTKTDNEGNMDGSLGDILADEGAMARFDRLESIELRQRLAQAIRNLPERERFVISLYYYEELTMKEVAQVIGHLRIARMPDSCQGRPGASRGHQISDDYLTRPPAQVRDLVRLERPRPKGAIMYEWLLIVLELVILAATTSIYLLARRTAANAVATQKSAG